MSREPNQLIHSQSPYLLQHAYNPVSWYPWGKEALEKAKSENKPIIVSIGYSACHWCHVMERESFENEETAQLMNEHFVCIKIDREERPDLDNIYMEALQAMGLQGGWPLNVFLMPNQKPFYGGTYFPPSNWRGLLANIAEAYQKHRPELEKSAEGFGRSLQRKEREKYGLQEDNGDFSAEELGHIAQQIKNQIDPEWGGLNRVPKFPMPSVWLFLLDYAMAKNDHDLQEKVFFTLKKMGMGGIYDHLAGGFARYSVDGEWFAPHFEKMLYDNGQLLDLYAQAYLASGDRFFKEKINETVHWLQTEMSQEEGGFYAALDADSEGEEGKFYTWTKVELEQALGKDIPWLHDFYGIKSHGNWENGVNILFQTEDEKTVADRHQLSLEDFQTHLRKAKHTLLQQRNLRPRPGTDDKIISGWNGLTVTGLVKAYWATHLEDAKQLALQNGEFLQDKMTQDGILYRSYKNGEAYTPAFLEDYAAVIQAFIQLYQLDFDKKWLLQANSMAEYTLAHFLDEDEGLFYFNNPEAEALIANKKEIFDNVIPSSNSMMARNLHQLGCYFYNDDFLQHSNRLLKLMKKILVQEPGFLTNWARLYLEKLVPTAEVAIVGKGATSLAQELARSHWGNHVISATEIASKDIPLLADKVADSDGNALIYVCFNKACQQPVSSLKEALVQFPTLA